MPQSDLWSPLTRRYAPTSPPRGEVKKGGRVAAQLTPSFFCRLEDEVVYWNTTRLSGNT